MLSSAILEIWLDFKKPSEVITSCEVILMGRCFNIFVMYLVSLPTYVNFALLHESLLPFGSVGPCLLYVSQNFRLYVMGCTGCNHESVVVLSIPVLWLHFQGGNCLFF